MYVHDHRLFEGDGTPVPLQLSPNHGGALTPLFLVVHYSATLSLQSTVGWFRGAAAGASAHLVVGRQGEVVQMVPFDQRAWHAGVSRWGPLDNLNSHSIGIELINAGGLDASGAGWVDWARNPIADDDLVVARHRHQATARGWQRFPQLQIARATEIAQALHRAYRFLDVLGHDDVSPHRKMDPGPAFPMEHFAAVVLGRPPQPRVSPESHDGRPANPAP